MIRPFVEEAIARLVSFIVIELGVAPVEPGDGHRRGRSCSTRSTKKMTACGHAEDAIGSLLQARLICAEEQIEMPPAQFARASVTILHRFSLWRRAYAGHSQTGGNNASC